MPKRSRARFTPKRKKQTQATRNDSEDLSRPSVKEWTSMQSYRSFMVKDFEVEGQLHDFPVNAYAIIVPAGVPPTEPIHLSEYWVGKIKEIRSRGGDRTEVWARVQWLWSADDIAEQKKNLDTKHFGHMERLLSNSFDFIHTSCFQGIVDVVSYDEASLHPKTITDETFYYRYTYNYQTKEVKLEPQASCICNELYNPDDDSSMHFCPRETCQISFHSSCLRKANWIESWRTRSPKKRRRTTEECEGCAPRSVQLQRSLPLSKVDDIRRYSSDDMPPKILLSKDENESLETPRKKGRQSTAGLPSIKTESNDEPVFDEMKHRQDLLPPSLLQLARSPMVKGEKTTLPRDTGVVAGNIAFVLRAREIVNRFLVNKTDLSDDWKAELQLPTEREGANVEAWIVSDEELICPSCGGPI